MISLLALQDEPSLDPIALTSSGSLTRGSGGAPPWKNPEMNSCRAAERPGHGMPRVRHRDTRPLAARNSSPEPFTNLFRNILKGL
eukprot:3255997-Pyramimonas_sp.AAC.1